MNKKTYLIVLGLFPINVGLSLYFAKLLGSPLGMLMIIPIILHTAFLCELPQGDEE